jgi:hypothetical protein
MDLKNNQPENTSMQTTLPPQNEVELCDPRDPEILVRVAPSQISRTALVELAQISKLRGMTSDCLRTWLREVVQQEITRRLLKGGEHRECDPWLLPWHTWNDAELAAALAASYSWFEVDTEPATSEVLREIHRALVVATGTRLGELHEAIENSRRNRGEN